MRTKKTIKASNTRLEVEPIETMIKPVDSKSYPNELNVSTSSGPTMAIISIIKLLLIAQLTNVLLYSLDSRSHTTQSMISVVAALSLDIQLVNSTIAGRIIANQSESSTINSATVSSQRLTAPNSEFESSSVAAIAELIDGNYLEGRDVTQISSASEETGQTDGDINSLETKIQQPSKYRRQATADWWTKISTSNSNTKYQAPPTNNKPISKSSSSIDGTTKIQSPQLSTTRKSFYIGDLSIKPTVYREQPLNQNAILTIRNQLAAIRSKHKVLVTKSMQQLQQLDNKLIDSYKLCFKKKMPFYAGMLYRTRDFVTKMAKEVKHERKVLEAMTKQVQGVLREKMLNRTLVREYNNLLAPPTKISDWSEDSHQLNKLTPTKSKVIKENTSQVQQQAKANSISVSQEPSFEDSQQGRKQFGHEREFVTKRPPKPTKYTVSVNEVNLKKELNKIQSLIDRINVSSHDLSAVVDDIIYLFKLTSDHSNKKVFYSVDKPNKMYNQTTTDTTLMYNGSPERKRARKMFKSPIKVFLEKFGKLTMDNMIVNNGSNNSAVEPGPGEAINYPAMNSLPDVKPLFEPSSLTYSEPSDQDLGFDDNITSVE